MLNEPLNPHTQKKKQIKTNGGIRLATTSLPLFPSAPNTNAITLSFKISVATSFYLQPRFPPPLFPSPPMLPDFTADIVVPGEGPTPAQLGFVTLAAAPPNVTRRPPIPAPFIFTGESLALRMLREGIPFSLLPTLLAENTLLARPGETALLRRLVPRNGPGSARSALDGFPRRTP
jgi:hypothetical protein